MVRTLSWGFSAGSRSSTRLPALLLLAFAVGCDGGSQPGGGSGGAPASGGAGAGGSATGGTPGAGGASGGAVETGGSASGGTASGGSASGGTGSETGGTSSGGSPAGGSAGTGGGGGSGECTRELLGGILDDYLDALAAHDASTLPLADGVKFTENADVLEIGTAGLWLAAGAAKHSQRAIDLEQCTVAAHVVIPDGATDIPFAVRIKLEDLEITEVETIAARPGDFAAVTSNPAAIIAIADEVGWDVPVPQGQQNTREEIIAWMDKYFRLFPSGVCNVTGDCTRLENGGGNYSCGGGASCSPNEPGPGDSNLDPRLILADVEMGVGVGLTIYNGHTDMHMFKMIDGEVSAVQVVLSQSGGESGWD